MQEVGRVRCARVRSGAQLVQLGVTLSLKERKAVIVGFSREEHGARVVQQHSLGEAVALGRRERRRIEGEQLAETREQVRERPVIAKGPRVLPIRNGAVQLVAAVRDRARETEDLLKLLALVGRECLRARRLAHLHLCALERRWGRPLWLLVGADDGGPERPEPRSLDFGPVVELVLFSIVLVVVIVTVSAAHIGIARDIAARFTLFTATNAAAAAMAGGCWSHEEVIYSEFEVAARVR